MQIVVDNTLVTYSDTGKGPVLLCVHGWMHNHSSYTQLSEELKSEYRVIALDLPNFGGSEMTERIKSVEDYALFLDAFVKKLSIKDYVLVGHSMGCQIAIYATAHKILTPKKLVLLSAAGVRDKRKVYKKSLRYASKILRHVVPKPVKARFYKRIGSDYNPDMSAIHKKIINETLSTDIQKEAHSLQLSTLLITGTEDKETPLWMAQILNSEIAGSTLDIMNHGDHFVHQKAAPEVAKIMKVFLG